MIQYTQVLYTKVSRIHRLTGGTEGPPKCLEGADHQDEARSWLDYGGVSHVSPPWIERHVHDQLGVVGFQWV